MARTTEQMIADAEALARRFEAGELPDPARTLDGRPLREVREAFEDLAHAEQRLIDRVTMARAAGHSWASIGMMVGTSGEAVRQRYGRGAGSARKGSGAAAGRPAGAVTAVASPPAGRSGGQVKAAAAVGLGGRVTKKGAPAKGAVVKAALAKAAAKPAPRRSK